MEKIKNNKIYGNFDFKVLTKGKREDLYWFIVSYGSHPCSYIALPSIHPLYEVGYMEIENMDYNDIINLKVHGGLTFSGNDYGYNVIDIDTWFIGWDYSHVGDYHYYHKPDYMDKEPYKSDKVWTIKDLKKEMNETLNQIQVITEIPSE